MVPTPLRPRRRLRQGNPESVNRTENPNLPERGPSFLAFRFLIPAVFIDTNFKTGAGKTQRRRNILRIKKRNKRKQIEIQKKLTVRDLITIGMMGAVSLLIFFTTGGIAAFTLIGTIANIPIVCFFTSIACMLLVSKVHKLGTFFIMGFINVLPGLTAANLAGLILSAIGWGIADLFASLKNYRGKKILISAYVLGCTLQSALFTLPMYLSGGQYLIERKELLRLSDTVLQKYLSYFIWPVFGINIILTILTSLLGAVIAFRILEKHIGLI